MADIWSDIAGCGTLIRFNASLALSAKKLARHALLSVSETVTALPRLAARAVPAQNPRAARHALYRRRRLPAGMAHMAGHLACDLLTGVIEIMPFGFQQDRRPDRVFQLVIGL